MKFEKFAGSKDPGKRVKEEPVRTTSSEGTRRDATEHPIEKIRYESWMAEYDALVPKLQLVDVQLHELADESRRAHHEHMAAHRSRAVWVEREKEFEERRALLVDQKTRLQHRLAYVRPRAKQEQRLQHNSEEEDKFGPLRELLQRVVHLQEAQLTALGEIRDGLAALARR